VDHRVISVQCSSTCSVHMRKPRLALQLGAICMCARECYSLTTPAGRPPSLICSSAVWHPSLACVPCLLYNLTAIPSVLWAVFSPWRPDSVDLVNKRQGHKSTMFC
jgi:hypothetical protein